MIRFVIKEYTSDLVELNCGHFTNLRIDWTCCRDCWEAFVAQNSDDGTETHQHTQRIENTSPIYTDAPSVYARADLRTPNWRRFEYAAK